MLRALTIKTSGYAEPDSFQGSLDLLVFKILSRNARLHGYAIMLAIQEISDDVLRVEEGSLYPALHRMEQAAWIRAKWVMKENSRRARIYELTKARKGPTRSRMASTLAAEPHLNREFMGL